MTKKYVLEMSKIGKSNFDQIKIGIAAFDEVVGIVAQANRERIGGHDDWVAPDTWTLKAMALIDPCDEFVWSSSPYVGNSDYACGVYFGDGGVSNYGRGSSLLVRLVRGCQCLAIGRAGQIKSLADAGIEIDTRKGGAA